MNNKSLENLILEWEKVIKNSSFSSEGPNYSLVSKWYEQLNEVEKSAFDDFIIDKIKGRLDLTHDKYYMTAHFIKSLKIYNYFITFINELIKKNELTSFRTDFLTLLLQYKRTNDSENILQYFLNQKQYPSLRITALQVSSQLIPSLAVEYLPNIKDIYNQQGSLYLYLIYDNLLNYFSDDFSNILYKVKKFINQEEIIKLKNTMNTILSKPKWQTKKEKLLREIEEILG